jgi:hypothetical protein
MQDHSKPVLVVPVAEKPHRTARPSRADVLKQASRAVSDALKRGDLHSAPQIAEALRVSGGEFVPALADILLTDFYLREIRSQRRQQAKENSAQLRLPGFDHLPLKIRTAKGKMILLIEATFTQVRAYYRSLAVDYDKRRRNDPRIKEVKRLMEKMRRRARTRKDITVQEVMIA